MPQQQTGVAGYTQAHGGHSGPQGAGPPCPVVCAHLHMHTGSDHGACHCGICMGARRTTPSSPCHDAAPGKCCMVLAACGQCAVCLVSSQVPPVLGVRITHCAAPHPHGIVHELLKQKAVRTCPALPVPILTWPNKWGFGHMALHRANKTHSHPNSRKLQPRFPGCSAAVRRKSARSVAVFDALRSHFY